MRFEDADDNFALMERFTVDRSQSPAPDWPPCWHRRSCVRLSINLDPVEGREAGRARLALAETLGDRRSQTEIYWDLMRSNAWRRAAGGGHRRR